MSLLSLPAMPENWEPTRATLHNYANAVGAIARAHAVPHDKWWHMSLKVRPVGLVTDTMPISDGGTFGLRMDLLNSQVVLETSNGQRHTLAMDAGLTGTEFGKKLIAIVDSLGVAGEYATEKYASDEPREYDAGLASEFFSVLVAVDHDLEVHRSALGGSVGPLQIWPHGFDLAFEWYGTKTVSHDEGGESVDMQAQLNLGFYPAGRPYFYSNPWPFDKDALLGVQLPSPAGWNTEGWEGSILYYDDLLATSDPTAVLLEYARAVHAAAAPTLND